MKGFVFTIEVLCVLTVVIAVLVFFTGFFSFVSTPDFDSLNVMAVVHDMGEADTSLPPPGFAAGEACEGDKYSMGIYQFGIGNLDGWGVCIR